MVLVRLLALIGICVSLALVACGDDSDDDAPAAQSEAPAAETTADDGAAGEEGATADQATAEKDGAGDDGGASKPGIEITTADSQFGEALFDGDQRAIYYFDKEQTAASACYGACAEAWPPVLTDGNPQAQGGAAAKLLGTTERDDGSTQVTYNGRPLYYYVDDPAGEILCHNVNEFGGLWLAVQPNGDAHS
jgi:predicted lipoprotein with Yx(FWY)xxD motif